MALHGVSGLNHDKQHIVNKFLITLQALDVKDKVKGRWHYQTGWMAKLRDIRCWVGLKRPDR